MSRVSVLASLSFVLLGLNGCGEPLPEGMPSLHSAKVTVTQGGAPLADASVTLIPEDSTLSRWPVGAKTDASGSASLQTMSKFSGAPAGKYKVIVNKSITEGEEIPAHPGASATPEQMKEYDKAMKAGGRQVFFVVEEKVRNSKTTPLSVTVEANGPNEFALDAGKAVKEKDAKASGSKAGLQSVTPGV